MNALARFVVRRRLIAAAGMVGALTALARLIAAGREIAFAGRFGVADAVDAYFVALALPTIVTGVVASSLQSVVLPRYVVARQTSESDAARLLSATLKRVAVISVGLAGALLALSPVILSGFRGSFDRQLAFRLVAVMLPTVVLGPLSATLGVPLLARRAYLAFGVPPVVNAVVALALLLATPRTGVLVAAGGLALGSAAELSVMVALNRRIVGRVLQKDGLSAGLDVRVLAGVAIGVAIANVNPFVDQLFASRLSEGSIAVLGYAWRMTALLLVVPSLAIANAVAPLFAELHARNDIAALSSSLRHQTKVILVVGIAMAATVVTFAQLVVAVALEQGRFDAAAAAETTSVLRALAWQLPFYALTVLYTRVLIIVGRGASLPRVALLGLGVNVVADYVLGELFGLRGIAFASVIVQLAMFAMLAHFVRHALEKIEVDDAVVTRDAAAVSV